MRVHAEVADAGFHRDLAVGGSELEVESCKGCAPEEDKSWGHSRPDRREQVEWGY